MPTKKELLLYVLAIAIGIVLIYINNILGGA